MLTNTVGGSCFWITKDRRQLLQQWVQSNADPNAIEADLVLSKSQSNQHRHTRELLTVAQMQERKVPLAKIRAIVARGSGVPDPDCPSEPSLVRFWISTGTSEVDCSETSMQSQVRMQVDAAAALSSSFNHGRGATHASSAIGADPMQQILQGLHAPSAPAEDPGLGLLNPYVFKFLCSGIICIYSHIYQTLYRYHVSLDQIRTCCKSSGQSKGEGKGESQKCSLCGSGLSRAKNFGWSEDWDGSWPQFVFLLNPFQNVSQVLYGFVLQHPFIQGSLLKKEMSSVTSIALELPPSNELRETLNKYKTRLEEYLDEFLGITLMYQLLNRYTLHLRIKTITTQANINDFKTEIEGEAQIYWNPFVIVHALLLCATVQVKQCRIIKAQARAVLAEMRKQKKWSAKSTAWVALFSERVDICRQLGRYFERSRTLAIWQSIEDQQKP